VNVVVPVDPVSVPVIAPVLVFKLAPPGSAPDCTAKLVAFVAATVKLIVPKAATVPKFPAAVVHAGASDTVNNAEADLHAIPSLFSNLKKYVPSTGNVKFAVTEVALENVTEFADTIAPVDELIASTKGGVELSLKFVPVITTFAALLSITVGLIDEIVGNVILSAKDNVPDPLVAIT
tara:strand:- start:19 stop:552 length:534 start_codon:yes stop_codon:yes gene_type:complete